MIVLDLLYNDFDIITTSLLESKDKIINQIQSILQLRKAKNINKRTTKAIGNLAIVFKDNNNPKIKVYRDEKYFNYHKLDHFKCDC